MADVKIRFSRGGGNVTQDLVREQIDAQNKLVANQKAAFATLKKADDDYIAHHKASLQTMARESVASLETRKNHSKEFVKFHKDLDATRHRDAKSSLQQIEKDEQSSNDKRTRNLRENILKRSAENDKEKQRLQKSYQEKVVAHGKAQQAITNAEKFSATTIERLHGLSTKKLINEYKSLQDRKQVLLDARERAEGASAKRIVDNKIREIAREQRAYKSVALERGEVLTGGAGAKVGILGTGRQLISQSGLPISGMMSKGAAVAAGVLVAGKLTKEIIEIGMAFEDAMLDVSAITGVTGKDLDTLTGRVRENAKTFRIDAVDAANAYKLVISALGPQVAKDQASLESMSKSVMTLAKASGIDASIAADSLTTTLNQFGYAAASSKEQAAQMARIMNVMAAGSKEGAAEVGHLSESMKDVGTIAYQAGLSVEETVGILEIFSQAGIKGAESGTMARNGLLNMQQGSKEATDALKSMGLSFKDINPKVVGLETGLDRLRGGLEKLKSPTERTAALVKIFGERGIAGANIMLKATENVNGATSAFQNMTKAVTGTNTAQEQMETRAQSTSEKFKEFLVSLKDVGLEIFGVLKPGLDILLAGINALLWPLQKAIEGFNMLAEASAKKYKATASVQEEEFAEVRTADDFVEFLKKNRRQIPAQAKVLGSDMLALLAQNSEASDAEFEKRARPMLGNILLARDLNKALTKDSDADKQNVVRTLESEYKELAKQISKTTDTGMKMILEQRQAVVKKNIQDSGGLVPNLDLVLGGDGDGGDKPPKKGETPEQRAKREFDAASKQFEQFRQIKDAELARDIKNSALLEQLKLNNEEQYWASRLQLAKDKQQKEAIGEAEHQLALLGIRRQILNSVWEASPDAHVGAWEEDQQSRRGPAGRGNRELFGQSLSGLIERENTGEQDEHVKAFLDNQLKIQEESRESWSQWVDVLGNAFQSAFDVINEGFFSKIDEAFNTSNSIAGAFFGSLIKGLITMGEQIAIEALKTAVLNAIVGGIATATAGTILAAAAPAAMAMSIATLGAASATGAVAYHAAMSSASAIGLSEGGIVPQYLASGGMMGAAQSIRMGGFINKTFKPKGTDTVPAMLTPGEGVFSKPEMDKIGGPRGFSNLRKSIKYMASGGALADTGIAEGWTFGDKAYNPKNSGGPSIAEGWTFGDKTFNPRGSNIAEGWTFGDIAYNPNSDRQNNIAAMAAANPYSAGAAQAMQVQAARQAENNAMMNSLISEVRELKDIMSDPQFVTSYDADAINKSSSSQSNTRFSRAL